MRPHLPPVRNGTVYRISGSAVTGISRRGSAEPIRWAHDSTQYKDLLGRDTPRPLEGLPRKIANGPFKRIFSVRVPNRSRHAARLARKMPRSFSCVSCVSWSNGLLRVPCLPRVPWAKIREAPASFDRDAADEDVRAPGRNAHAFRYAHPLFTSALTSRAMSFRFESQTDHGMPRAWRASGSLVVFSSLVLWSWLATVIVMGLGPGLRVGLDHLCVMARRCVVEVHPHGW
jgi:hypothetical protein